MIGLRPRCVIRNPLITPATSTTASAVRAARNNLLSCPFARWVQITTVREIPPGHREVDPALLDDQRLPEAGDDQDRRVGKHAEDGSPADARWGKQPPRPTTASTVATTTVMRPP